LPWCLLGWGWIVGRCSFGVVASIEIISVPTTETLPLAPTTPSPTVIVETYAPALTTTSPSPTAETCPAVPVTTSNWALAVKDRDSPSSYPIV